MSIIDSIKLLGIMNLTEVQKDHLRTAYVLYNANGNVDARGRDSASLKMCMRRLVKMTLATERELRGVFDLTRVGCELGDAIGYLRRNAS